MFIWVVDTDTGREEPTGTATERQQRSRQNVFPEQKQTDNQRRESIRTERQFSETDRQSRQTDRRERQASKRRMPLGASDSSLDLGSKSSKAIRERRRCWPQLRDSEREWGTESGRETTRQSREQQETEAEGEIERHTERGRDSESR